MDCLCSGIFKEKSLNEKFVKAYLEKPGLSTLLTFLMIEVEHKEDKLS